MKDGRPLQVAIDVAEIGVLIAVFGYDSVGGGNIIKAWIGFCCVFSVLGCFVATSMDLPEPQIRLPQAYTNVTCVGAIAALAWFGWLGWAVIYGIAWFFSHVFKTIIASRRAAESV